MTRDQHVRVCECGCGRPTLLAVQNNPRYGHIKGQPMRFLTGHNSRTWRGAPRHTMPLLGEQFWSWVEAGDCWEWLGPRVRRNDNGEEGYGRYVKDGLHRLAHRYAYEALAEPIPTGMTVDHLCLNRTCVNPDHLQVVTRAENARRGRRAWQGEKVSS